MPDLTVAIVQDELDWERPQANRNRFERWLDQIGMADLVVLPEMFTTGFTMDAAAVAEPMDGPTVTWLCEQAAQRGLTITGSIVVEDGGDCYNRLLWVQRDGSIDHYDKRHLFRMANEHEAYSAGDRRLIVDCNGWAVAPFICYDLRFPVWTRRTGDYDVALFVANWPAPRHDAWATLLKARAMENQSYVIGVNRIGTDGNDVAYPGGSVALDFLGHELVSCGDQPGLQVATLSRDRLDEARERFPVALDADRFRIE